MAQTFAATVDEWVKSSQERMLAVFKTAVQFTFEEVQDRTPVDTGYLRASFTASTTGYAPLKSGHGIRGGGYEAQPVVLAISGVEMGGTVYGNFTANYAQYVEYGTSRMGARAMVRLSAQNWQANVDRAVSLLRDR